MSKLDVKIHILLETERRSNVEDTNPPIVLETEPKGPERGL
jgi:hypothetical protein